ncbi:MAG TPA: DMT family transporter [Candidatus Kryptonia bacterium]
MNPYAVLVFQILFSSGTHIVANDATQTIPPAILAFLRTVLSGAIYIGYTLYRGTHFRFRGKDLKLLLIIGFLSVPINQFIFLYGIKFATAKDAALLYALTPVLVLLISGFYLRERITGTKAIGSALAFLGVLIIVLENGLHVGISQVKGDILLFIAVVAWALYTSLGRRLVVRYGAMTTTIYVALIGSLMFAPFGIWSSIGYDFGRLNFGQWMEVLYLAIFTSIVGYVLWYYALSKIEATKVAVFTNGQPIMTAILAYFFLGQSISLIFVVGAVVTIGGVLITQIEAGHRRESTSG